MKIQYLPITPDILSLIAEIDEFQGAWRALEQLAPDQLKALKNAATIESIGSSTRIEGSKLSNQEVEALLVNASVQNLETRDQQEVAGYSSVLNLIFENFDIIPLAESYIKQLHSELLKYSDKDNWHKGNYKISPNHVEAFASAGKNIRIVFETATPFETPIRMETLINWTNQALNEKKLHPLLIIGLFIVEFLAIHPFQDGNGRLSRLLTSYLLLKNGYAFVPYSSLEAVVEYRKEEYYLALRQTQGTLKCDTPNWQPWILFFLNAIKTQTHKLKVKLESER